MRRLPQRVDRRRRRRGSRRRGDRDADARERAAGGLHVARLGDGDCRAGLREPVGRADREAGGRGRARAARRGIGAAAEQHARAAPGRASAPASSSRCSCVGHERDERDAVVAQHPRRPPRRRRRRREHGGRGHDRRAQEDHQAADVRERQRAQPALVAAERRAPARARARSARVAVGELDRLGRARRARRVDDERDVVELGRRPGAGHAACRPSAAARRRLDLAQHRRALPLGEPQVDRHGRRAEQQAAVQRDDERRRPGGSASATRSPRRTPRACSAPAARTARGSSSP